MSAIWYAVLVGTADALGALLAGWYLDLRQVRDVRRSVIVGGVLVLVGNINVLGFIAAGWWMMPASVAGAMLGDRLSFVRWRRKT